ncbi:MAG: thiolase family protein [Gammaproteobacteria bacterium]|nr:thiolase family protein [Gammaproteobacteria bacterium]
MSISGKVAVSGFAEMQPQKSPGDHTPLSIAADVGLEAIADAGLEKAEIDGLIVGSSISNPGWYWSLAAAEYLGLKTKFLQQYLMPTGMLWRAAAAIEAGLCNNVLCVVGDTWDSKLLMKKGPPPFPYLGEEMEAPYGVVGAPPGYAMITRRHMHEFGTTAEQLAKVAVDQRYNACHNPTALFGHKEIGIEDVLASRMICDPVHLLEAVSPCTGGAAFVVTSVEGAKRSDNPPVVLLGAGEAGNRWSLAAAKSLTTSPVKESAEGAFKMAGLTPADMDFAQLYDCFTAVVIISLEDAGFCAKGEGGRFVEANDLTFKGNSPCNTHGGQLSFGQPGIGGGMSQVVEAIRQLMGRGGARQVQGATRGFVNNNGGIMAKECSLVLGVG